METRAAGVQRVYRDFVPSHELVPEESLDTLIIELPEFKKEQIRVQIDGYRNLWISGERPLADNQWNRFRKDFRVPEDCNLSQIRAKFDSGRLSVTLPKFVTETGAKDRPTQVQKPKENQKPKGEPKPSIGKDDVNQKAAPRPSIEPKGVPEKQQDEKRDEPIGMRKDAEKVGEKEKEQIEVKKGKKKVANGIKHEEGEKGGATTEAPKITQVQKPKETQKPKGEPKPSTGKDDVNQKVAPRPSIEPIGVPEKQQDEKRGEPIDTRKDAEKVGEKKKDQIEEKKGKKKVASDIKHEEGEKGGATTEAPKEEETIEHAAPSSGQDRLGMLKLKVGQLALGFYKPRQLMVNVIAAVAVLVGLGSYVTYKLSSGHDSPMVEDGH